MARAEKKPRKQLSTGVPEVNSNTVTKAATANAGVKPNKLNSLQESTRQKYKRHLPAEEYSGLVLPTR